MKINKNLVFSLLIVFLFVGSMFAMIVYSDRSGDNDYVIPDTNQNLELENYTAVFDANVNEVFPQIVVAGKPVDYEEANINSKLLDITGIRNKQLEFTADGEGNINLILTLTILLDKKMEILQEIQEKEIFEEMEVYQFGLLEVPELVVFTNDENKEIEYEFYRANIEGILNIDTQKGDELSVLVYGVFRGTELIQARGFEQTNKSTQFQLITGKEYFKILGFKENIVVYPTFTLEKEINKEKIKENILSLYPETEIEDYVFKKLEIETIDKNIEDYLELLEELKENKEIIDLEIIENTVIFDLEENITKEKYLEAKEKIKKILEFTEDDILTDLEYQMKITFKYLEIDTEKIEEILGTTDLSFEILATVDTSSVVLNGLELKYQEPETEVYLDYPSDLELEEIILEAQGYYQRDTLLFLMLNKETTQERK